MNQPNTTRRIRLDRLRIHLRLIDEGIGPVVAAHREHIQCRAGCSECCSQSFGISEIEAELMLEGLAELPLEIAADILDRARHHRTGAPCPVLSADGLCRLYAHRPRICRKYGIPLWDPDRPEQVRTCHRNFRGVIDIDPSLIIEPQAGWAEDWIGLHRDLRLPHQHKRSIAQWLAERGPSPPQPDPGSKPEMGPRGSSPGSQETGARPADPFGAAAPSPGPAPERGSDGVS